MKLDLDFFPGCSGLIHFDLSYGARGGSLGFRELEYAVSSLPPRTGAILRIDDTIRGAAGLPHLKPD
jgi:hypothetical protein